MPDSDAVAERFRNALDIVYWDAPALVDTAKTLAESGQTGEAIARYRMALEIEPDNAAAHQGLGVESSKAGRKAEAILHLRRALEICGENLRLQIHIDLAEALADHSRPDEALVHLRKALDLAAADNDKALVKKIRAAIDALQPDAPWNKRHKEETSGR